MSYYYKGVLIGNVQDIVRYLVDYQPQLLERICDENDIDQWEHDHGMGWDLSILEDWFKESFEYDDIHDEYGIHYVNDALDIPVKNSYDEMELARRMWMLHDRNPDPKIVELSQKEDIKQFAGDYWDYVKWNNHGNEPGIDEIADSHGELVKEIAGKEDYGMVQSITGGEDYKDLDDRQKGLLDRLRALNEKYRLYNRKSKKPRLYNGKPAEGWR